MQNRLHERLSFDNVKDAERIVLPSRSRLPLILTSASISLALVLMVLLLLDDNGLTLLNSTKTNHITNDPNTNLPSLSETTTQANNYDSDANRLKQIKAQVKLSAELPKGAATINLNPQTPLQQETKIIGDFAAIKRNSMQKEQEMLQQLAHKATITDERLNALDRSFGSVDEKLNQLQTLFLETKDHITTANKAIDSKVDTLSASITTIQNRFDTFTSKKRNQLITDIGGAVTSPFNTEKPSQPLKKIIKTANVNTKDFHFFPERRTAILAKPSIPKPKPSTSTSLLASVGKGSDRSANNAILTSSIAKDKTPSKKIPAQTNKAPNLAPIDRAQQAVRQATQAQLARKLSQSNLEERSTKSPLSPLSESILAIDLGEVNNLDQVRSVWNKLLQTDGDLLGSMVPAVTVMELSKNAPKLRLLVGPVENSDEIARLCSELIMKRPCRPALFEGTRVSLR